MNLILYKFIDKIFHQYAYNSLTDYFLFSEIHEIYLSCGFVKFNIRLFDLRSEVTINPFSVPIKIRFSSTLHQQELDGYPTVTLKLWSIIEHYILSFYNSIRINIVMESKI